MKLQPYHLKLGSVLEKALSSKVILRCQVNMTLNSLMLTFEVANTKKGFRPIKLVV